MSFLRPRKRNVKTDDVEVITAVAHCESATIQTAAEPDPATMLLSVEITEIFANAHTRKTTLDLKKCFFCKTMVPLDEFQEHRDGHFG